MTMNTTLKEPTRQDKNHKDNLAHVRGLGNVTLCGIPKVWTTPASPRRLRNQDDCTVCLHIWDNLSPDEIRALQRFWGVGPFRLK